MATDRLDHPSWDIDALFALDFPIMEYEVCREKILEYVAAVGDRNPCDGDVAVASRLGQRGVVAPPTFAAVFATTPIRRAIADDDWTTRAGIDPARVLHGEQSLTFHRGLVPGDRLIIQAIVADAYERKDLAFLVVATRVDTERGERVLDGRSTLVLRR